MTAQIITLEEAKTFLNITGTDDDDELQTFVDAAESMWLNRGGPGASSPSYDEWHSGGRAAIVLNHIPVLAITSIVEAEGTSSSTLTEQDPGSASGSYGYSLDKKSGIVTRRVNGYAARFASGLRNVHVVYTAGYVSAPDDVKLAIKLLTLHGWETQRGDLPPSDDGYVQGTTYSWPRRVEEILAGYKVPGIA